MPTDLRRRLGVIAVVGIVAAVAAGCSGGQSASKSSANVAAPAQLGVAGSEGVQSAAKPAGPGAASNPPVNLAVAKRPGGDRQVISTAQLQLQARDVDQVVQRASALVLDAQGYVFSETAGLTDQGHANVVFKVVPEHFNDVVTGIGHLGKLVHRQIGTQDVTGQVVDLGARLSAAQTSAARLQQLLSNSGGVADLLSVEQQLTTREGEVDSLSGQLAAVRAQVDMATITLDVNSTPRPAAPKRHHASPSFTRGLHAGNIAFAATARVIAAAAGLALPFAPIALLALAVWWIVRRRTAATPPVS
jgi:hypothetical protein